MAARDRERQTLYDLRRAAPPGSELAPRHAYVRERIRAAGWLILAFEVFEPKGNYMVVYRFWVRESEEREAPRGGHRHRRRSPGSDVRVHADPLTFDRWKGPDRGALPAPFTPA